MPTDSITMLLTALAAVSAALAIWGEFRTDRRVLYVFKPLTMIFILTIAARAEPVLAPRYKNAILLGLLCSLAGDVFLMLPTDLFLAGLVSFFFAHLCYIYAFALSQIEPAPFLYSIPFVVYGALMLTILKPGLGAMKVPATFYMMAISVMAWQALGFGVALGGPHGVFAFAGALTFVASDTILAFNRFKSPFRAAPILILGTYFVAQWLIALSI